MSDTAISIFANRSGDSRPTMVTEVPRQKPLRILAISALWQGANDYAFVRAFRRAGHSVLAVSEREYLPSWQSKSLKVLRRSLRAQVVKAYNEALKEKAHSFRPDIFFVFKGSLIKAETLQAIKAGGAIAIQFYPDVSFRTHGPFLAEALREYDWVFTTKSYGLGDMDQQLGIKAASFAPHAFDPETHRPIAYLEKDAEQYGCETSFIGNWSSKKERILSALTVTEPSCDLKIWGPSAWGAAGDCAAHFQGYPVFGDEYAKAIQLSKVNIGLLSEARTGASSGDHITARTFEIPASGGFMLHERTEEAMQYFEDGKECAFFDGPDDLVEKVRYYLAHEDERAAIAQAGHQRCLTSGYSVDDRARSVIDKYYELAAKREEQR